MSPKVMEKQLCVCVWILSSLSDRLCTVWCLPTAKHPLPQTSKKLVASVGLSLSSPASSHCWDTQIPVYRPGGTKHVMWCVFDVMVHWLYFYQSRSWSFSDVAVILKPWLGFAGKGCTQWSRVGTRVYFLFYIFATSSDFSCISFLFEDNFIKL